jgi:hypothetical protein
MAVKRPNKKRSGPPKQVVLPAGIGRAATTWIKKKPAADVARIARIGRTDAAPTKGRDVALTLPQLIHEALRDYGGADLGLFRSLKGVPWRHLSDAAADAGLANRVMGKTSGVQRASCRRKAMAAVLDALGVQSEAIHIRHPQYMIRAAKLAFDGLEAEPVTIRTVSHEELAAGRLRVAWTLAQQPWYHGGLQLSYPHDYPSDPMDLAPMTVQASVRACIGADTFWGTCSEYARRTTAFVAAVASLWSGRVAHDVIFTDVTSRNLILLVGEAGIVGSSLQNVSHVFMRVQNGGEPIYLDSREHVHDDVEARLASGDWVAMSIYLGGLLSYYSNLVSSMAKSRECDHQAAEVYRSLLTLAKSQPLYYYMLIEYYMAHGMTDAAIAVLETLPDDLETLAFKGRTYERAAMYGEATAAYRSVLEADPNNTLAGQGILRLASRLRV